MYTLLSLLISGNQFITSRSSRALCLQWCSHFQSLSNWCSALWILCVLPFLLLSSEQESLSTSSTLSKLCAFLRAHTARRPRSDQNVVLYIPLVFYKWDAWKCALHLDEETGLEVHKVTRPQGFNANRRRSRAVLYQLSGHLQKQDKGKLKINNVSALAA